MDVISQDMYITSMTCPIYAAFYYTGLSSAAANRDSDMGFDADYVCRTVPVR